MKDLDQRLLEGPLKVQSLWSPEQTAELPEAVDRRLRKRFLQRAAVGVVMTAGALGLLVIFRSLPVSSATASVSPPAEMVAPSTPLNTRVVRFEDGSSAKLKDAGSRLEVLGNAKRKVSTALLSGEATFDVVPNPTRVFEVSAGAVKVRVLGTRFSVAREQQAVRVKVTRGLVQVTWPGGSQKLSAGAQGLFPPAPSEIEPKPIVKATPKHAAKAKPSWRELARHGNYRQAYRELERLGPTTVRHHPQDLMLQADVARLSGHPEQAVLPLRKVVSQFKGDHRAPVAAFTLGRVLDQLGRPAEAAQAFKTARITWPGGPLAVDALAREAEARQRAGQSSAAAALAKLYLEQYPKGRHAGKLRRLSN